MAITLLSMWGWRRGDSWVWWTLALAALAGFMPALATHGGIGYTDLGHVAPVYCGIVLTMTGLILSWPYLCARPVSASVTRRVSRNVQVETVVDGIAATTRPMRTVTTATATKT